MKIDRPPPNDIAAVTLQTVMNRLAADRRLGESRKRDLRSAVTIFAKLCNQPPTAIALDLAAIRQRLDRMVPVKAMVSPKRWANIRSDLAAAIAASGLRPMLRTAGVELNGAWRQLLANAPQYIVPGLSRFARWATLRSVGPKAVDESTFQHFDSELHSSTLVRNLRHHSRLTRRAWNTLAAQRPKELRKVLIATDANSRVLKRTPWGLFPATFREDVEAYLDWAAVPDPIDETARPRALSLQTLRLQRNHIHSAASTAAVSAGIQIKGLTSLARMVEPETFRAILRHRRLQDGAKPTAYTHGIAITLIAIAAEWVKASPETVAALKALRSRLGSLPAGLTDKNKTLLRTLDDPQLLAALVQLPDRMWRAAHSTLATSYRSFGDLQTALALDILVHVPLRMQNLSILQFGVHLHWPRGPRKPALITLRPQETKTRIELNYELAAGLAHRLHVYRNEIAPMVIGKRPDVVFVRKDGKPKTQPAIAEAIQKAILRYLGIKMTPHQFRHLCAKIILDHNPGAYELVRQNLGHTSQKTTTAFYAGIDTRRAGRAHAELIMQLRQSGLGPKRGRRAPDERVT